MTFVEAITTCLKKYVDFNGRARRSEYWYFALFDFIVSLVVNIIARATGLKFLTALVSLAFLLPGLAVGARRLHDIGYSGLRLLLGLIPIVGEIILIVYFVRDSEPGSNMYGANPKEGY